MEKIIYYDLETTGLNYVVHGIVQIGGIVEIDGKETERFNILMRPGDKHKLDHQALNKIGKTRADLEKHPLSQEEGYREFKKIIDRLVNRYDPKDKIRLVGYNNSKFDDPFLSWLFMQNRDEYYGAYFYPDSWDVMTLSSIYLRGSRRDHMPNFKLHSVARELGLDVEEDKLHDAVYDIELTKQIFKIVSGEELEDATDIL